MTSSLFRAIASAHQHRFFIVAFALATPMTANAADFSMVAGPFAPIGAAFEGVAVLSMISAFTVAWIYCRESAQARDRANQAEAAWEAMRVHAQEMAKQAEALSAQAELAQESAEIAYQNAELARRNAETAQNSSEQALQFSATLLECATIIIIGIDDNANLRLFNETAQTITGYAHEELMEGSWLETLFPDEDFATARKDIMALMSAETPTLLETGLLPRFGAERTISWQCRHVLYCNEALALLFGVDLTYRATAERDRQNLERKLLDMQKLESLGVLAGGIAHDFNNLLTAILGNAQLAKLQLLRSSPVHQYLIEIERTSMQAADLCKQMLAYSGQGKIEVRPLDLNRVIRDMSQLLRISVAKNVQLSFNLGHALPMIRGDVSQIRQVLMNLIINASEAIGSLEGSIWVSTGMVHGAKHLFHGTSVTGQPEERDYVFIEIADTGCGMSEETKTRMFDPFFTTKFTGRGLGLAAVLGIVKSHGGTLELETHEGEGTTFTLLFPRAEISHEARGEDESASVSHWSGEGLVLVVDDEESVRTLTTRMLESFQFHVITACDGRDGVDKFHTHADAITAVLMDVTMPVMGGLQALERIRELRPDMPVLFMSGYMREGELRNLNGSTDYLQKPFKLEELQEKLRMLIDGRGGGGD